MKAQSKPEPKYRVDGRIDEFPEDSIWRMPAKDRDAALQKLDEERHARYNAGCGRARRKEA